MRSLDLDAFAGTVRARAIAENALIEQAGAEPLDVDEIVDRFIEYGARLQPYVFDTVTLLHEAVASGAHVLLEGAQATFLDLDHGTYPVRDVVEPDRRRGVRRDRARSARPRPHRRHHEGVHDTRSAPGRSRPSCSTPTATR